MRAIQCRQFGELTDLELAEVEAPAMTPDGVRIAVRAAGLNFADALMIAGKYQVKPELPFIPGLEAAGEVIEVGADVRDVAVGDRVMAVLEHGAFAEQVVVPAAATFTMPEAMAWDVAAAFPVAYGTSHLGLTHRVGLKAGETLLVLGAAGGVGLTAVQCGKVLGATVIAAASSAEKLAIAKANGADHLVNYADDDMRAAVLELTDGRGADVIYDPVGGDSFKTCLRCIGWEGRIVVVGFASGDIPQIPANYLLVKNCSAVGFFWGAYRQHNPDLVRASLAESAQWSVEGKLNSLVSERFALADAVAALGRLVGRHSTGKVVLEIDG